VDTPHRWNASNKASSDRVPADIAKGVSAVAKNATKVFGGGKGPGEKNAVVKKDLVKGAVKASATKVKAANVTKKLGVTGHQPGVKMPGLPSLGKSNVNQLLPTSLAGKVAGLEFDPQIREAQLQQAYGKRDEAQAQRDLSSWYGQVRGSQETAGQRDKAAADSARGSVANELQGIVQSLGGSRGAGVVGAQGMADLTSLAAQGQSQEQYNADLAPILAGEEAGQHSRQSALASQMASKLAESLINLRGQRGQAEAKALLQILPLNNQARQQNFANRQAGVNTAIAGQSLGLDMAKTLAGIRQGDRSLDIQASATKARNAKTAAGTPSWLAMSHGDRQAAVNSALAPYLDPTSGALLKGLDPNNVLNKARATLRGQGFSSARKMGYKGRGVVPRAQRDILTLLHSTLAGASTPQRAALTAPAQ
jgi:hypothetical protein